MSKIYIEVFRGESAYYISEHYQLQPHPKDTERDTYFLNRDIIDWKSRATKIVIGKDTYYAIFNCEIEGEALFVQKYHHLKEIGKIKSLSVLD